MFFFGERSEFNSLSGHHRLYFHEWGSHSWKYYRWCSRDEINFDLSLKKKICLFHAFNPFWEELYQNPVQFFSVIRRGIPLPHSNALQYYVKRKNCKVNHVTFPSGCEARAINLDNKNMKIGIFTGGTSVSSKNIFTAISRYPTGKHEKIEDIWGFFFFRWKIEIYFVSWTPSVIFSPKKKTQIFCLFHA